LEPFSVGLADEATLAAVRGAELKPFLASLRLPPKELPRRGLAWRLLERVSTAAVDQAWLVPREVADRLGGGPDGQGLEALRAVRLSVEPGEAELSLRLEAVAGSRREGRELFEALRRVLRLSGPAEDRELGPIVPLLRSLLRSTPLAELDWGL